MKPKASFFSKPAPAPAGVPGGGGGIPRQRTSKFDKPRGAATKPAPVKVPPDANPELPWEGTVRYSSAIDALRRLEQEGFDDSPFGEMVSLSGRFASIESLDGDPYGACEVHIRRAFGRPRP